MDTNTAEGIKELVNRAPTTPGCYLWKNAQGDVIYVGKAVNLRSRLRNYLNPPRDQIKTVILMGQTRDLEWITTETGAEALILESNLVKKYNPRYNVRLKDDKRYPYICVSTSEAYPRVFITRDTKNKKNMYFGPYTDVRATRNTLNFIHKIFPIRKTPLKLPLKKAQRPCMNFHIKRCLGPCQGTVPEDEYTKLVNEIVLFLEGRKEILENTISSRMHKYSESMDYEKAAIYRDMLTNIRRVTERQSVMSPGGMDEDVIALARQKDQGQIVLMEIREGRVLGRKSYPLVGLENTEPAEILGSFLRDYYLQASFFPARIVVPEKIKEKRELLQMIEDKISRQVKITIAIRDEQRSIMRIAERNAALLLSERILAVKHRDRKDALLQIQEMLQLKEIPTVMECYDISHFQGTEPVASGVMFVDGNPFKSGYRRYKIKTIEGINDPAMIQEAVARRLTRLLNEDKALPDLMVIDGGLTQLNAACDAASSLGCEDLPIIGLAKQREEIYVPGRSAPLSFDKDSPAMKLLRHLRDESHRFGVTYHRSRRNKKTMKHLVEDIPDIGPERKKALLHFFTEQKIEEASLSELESVPGIGPKLAKKIHENLSIQGNGEN